MTLAKPYFIDVCWHFWPVDASEKVMAHAPCMLPTNQGQVRATRPARACIQCNTREKLFGDDSEQ